MYNGDSACIHRHRDVGVSEIILFKVNIVLDWWALSMHMQLT